MLNRSQLKALLDAEKIFPSRRLGQSFLVDANIVRKVVDLCAPRLDEHVLEIGPGLGAITAALCPRAASVLAVEVDHRLARLLRTSLPDPRLTVLEADFLDLAPADLTRAQVVLGNIPYAISTEIIFKLAELVHLGQPPRGVFLMLQREVADRLSALPSTGAYGVLTLLASLAFEPVERFAVPPNCFHPRPQVPSVFLHLRPRLVPLYAPALREGLTSLVRLLFQQRRKKLSTSLRRLLPETHSLSDLERRLGAEVPPGWFDRRPEELPLADFARLAAALCELGIELP